MAVRRTLKQKQRAEVHRQEEQTYSYSVPDTVPSTKKSAKAEPPKPVSHAEPSLSFKLFGYNPHLVYNDLLKTLLVTIVIVAILLALFFSVAH